MLLSILIPTFNRPAKLAQCLRRLAAQTLAPDDYEVLVAIDGPDETSGPAAREAWSGCRARLEVLPCPRLGLNAARNAALPRCRGRYLLSLNDDVLPEPGFLAAHLAAHNTAARRAIVSGYSPFTPFEHPSLFDTLARDTSMLFFYDQMLDAHTQPLRPAGHDWGFRHCWGLNFSAPLDAVRDAGAFVAVPMLYGYDDIELGWRLQRRFNMPVLFAPAARADHDHRYSPRDVLDRERKLGHAARRFAGINPEFCGDVFRRDITSPDELEYSRQFIARERATAERLERSFLGLDEIPASSIAGPHAAALTNLLYEQHLLLKRWHWRSGLLEAAQQATAPRSAPAAPLPEPRPRQALTGSQPRTASGSR